MEQTLGLLGGGTGSGGGGGGGGVTKEKVGKDYVGMSSEVLSYQKEAELELGLGLSLGGGLVKAKGPTWGGRILTAEDFPSGFSGRGGASAGGGSGVTGTKRAADCFGPSEVGSPSTCVSQVVGWPPIRTYRMNSLVNQTKALNADGDKGVSRNDGKDMNKKVNHGSNINDTTPQEKGHLGFVKVNMDGLPIGRKVDLNAHACYESLAQTLEEMFFKPAKAITSICGDKECVTQRSKLLDGLSEFVLTYEDKEGDWMLVGDVPWGYASHNLVFSSATVYLYVIHGWKGVRDVLLMSPGKKLKQTEADVSQHSEKTQNHEDIRG